MNKTIATFLLAAVVQYHGQAQAQSMAIAWDLYVYPSSGQTAEQQMADERECRQWSQEMTGVDPGNPGAGVQAATAPQDGEGLAAAQGAVRGAAGAALIGNLADEDAGEYALAGAFIGSVRGARRKEAANREAQAQAQAQTQAATQEKLETFKRAFTACMQGKEYTVN